MKRMIRRWSRRRWFARQLHAARIERLEGQMVALIREMEGLRAAEADPVCRLQIVANIVHIDRLLGKVGRSEPGDIQPRWVKEVTETMRSTRNLIEKAWALLRKADA